MVQSRLNYIIVEKSVNLRHLVLATPTYDKDVIDVPGFVNIVGT